MKIEAVVISINYSDFLRVTLPNNKHFFDKLVVVTDTADIETQRVCEFNNVQCIKTDVFYENPEIRKRPNKAKGINEGLKHLSKDGWVVQLDCDIWLPAMARQIIEKYPLDNNGIYTIDRLMCNSYSAWMKYWYFGKPINEGWCYTHTDIFPMGVRLVKYHSPQGYITIGYFQMWNPKASGIMSYPEEKASFDRTDTMFAQVWQRKDRHLIPDFVCIHLASENGKQGQNWFGRQSRPFRPMTLKEKLVVNFYKLIYFFKNLFIHKEKREGCHKPYIPNCVNH